MSTPRMQPWEKYPDLTPDRLALIGRLIRDARNETASLHEPQRGDNAWSLGCRAYARVCYAIRRAADEYPWLKILGEPRELEFSFAVGAVAFRFFTGDAGEVPPNYRAQSTGERRYVQLHFGEGFGASPGRAMRFAVGTIPGGQFASLRLLEVDMDGEQTDSWEVDLSGAARRSNVIPLQAAPVDLPPAMAEPIADAAGQDQPAGRRAGGGDAVS